jgi:transcription elongation factor GreA
MSEIKKLTLEGFKKIKDELKELKEVKRKQISERIQEAKEHGDLSENAEYHEAREEQSFIEGRILELENLLRNSVVIDINNDQDQIIRIGSKIIVEKNGETIEYSIVGSTEADPKNNSISCDSPLGQAFLGKKKGEIIKVKIPKGETEFKIRDIK